jgi:Flp pilus assembly protein TadD
VSPFFADDYFFLEQSRGRSLWGVLTSADPLGNFFRPVSRQIYFWMLSRIGGESSTLFHTVNLAIFLVSLLVLYGLARRLAGRTAAVFAIAFVGFHYAADVPVQWASGCQDLLAVLFATLTVYLHVRGQRALAAMAFLLGVLSKEAVAGAAIVAIVTSHASQERWGVTLRRGVALLAVAASWGAWWLWSLWLRPAAAHALSFDLASVPAAFVHLIQVTLSLEVRQGGGALGHWQAQALLSSVVAAAVVWLASLRDSGATDGTDDPARTTATRVGLLWAIVASLPIVMVTPIWSAYFYLWGLMGAGLLVGALVARAPLPARAACLAGLVFLSVNARALDEFAAGDGAWSWQSHVNRHYLERGSSTVATYLEQMRAARPTLPHRSVVFFGNVAVSSGWQAGDGPLLRWAYRDSTLRSYYLTQFSAERAQRGPMFAFVVEDGALKDKTNDPQLFSSFAFSMILAEKPAAAVDALSLAATRASAGRDLTYWRALARWAAGDTTEAKQDFRAAGIAPERASRRTSESIVRGETADSAAHVAALERARRSAGLDPWVHARLAAILLASGDLDDGAIEAYAYRTLAPTEPDAWRKWASAQIANKQYAPALASLERYFALSGADGRADLEAQVVAESLRQLTRGDLAHQNLRTQGGS